LVVLWFLAIALCAIVGAGVALINPWLLVPFAVVAIAPIVAAFIGSSPSATRPASGKPQSRAESFIVSAAVTIVIAVLVGVAGVVALFVQCVQAFGSAMI
jgi:hypothetical protein